MRPCENDGGDYYKVVDRRNRGPYYPWGQLDIQPTEYVPGKTVVSDRPGIALTEEETGVVHRGLHTFTTLRGAAALVHCLERHRQHPEMRIIKVRGHDQHFVAAGWFLLQQEGHDILCASTAVFGQLEVPAECELNEHEKAVVERYCAACA